MSLAALPSERSAVRELVKSQISMRPDWRFAAFRLAANAVVAVAGLWLILSGGAVAAVVGVGLMTAFSASLMYGQHECLHRSLFVRPWINDGLGLLMGLLMGVPYAGYRRFHLNHHAHTHAEHDSEPVLVLTGVWHWVGYMAVAAHSVRVDSTVQLVRAFTSRNRVPRVLAVLSVAGLVSMIGAGVYLAISSPRLLLLGFVLPWILASPLFGDITLADHYGCAYGPDDTLRTTRTTIGNWFTRYLAWDANYDSEHHLSAAVPTSSLVAFHEVLAPYLVHHARVVRAVPHATALRPAPQASRRSAPVDVTLQSAPVDGRVDQARATRSRASTEK